MIETDTIVPSCFQINPILLTEKRKYIYGTDKNAVKLFLQLVSLHIEIEGFVTKKEEKENAFLFRKPIVSQYIVEKAQDIQVLGGNNIIKSPIKLNDSLNRENVVIYGAGFVGQQIKQYLGKEGVSIKCFIDIDSNKTGTMLDGIYVYNKDILKALPDNTSIIIAGKHWREINEIIKCENNKLDRFFVENTYWLDVLENYTKIIVDFERNLTIRSYAICALNEHYSDKKIIIYGEKLDVLRQYAQIYWLFGFTDVVLAVDSGENVPNEWLGFPVIDIVDVIYEDNVVVLVTDINRQSRLIELGLVETKDYTFINLCNECFYRKPVFDINLGHAYLNDEYGNQTQVCIYGNQEESDYKIAILGGSTSEGKRGLITTWAEFLVKEYMKKGVTIYNFAASGYTSGQELIKLIRDVIPLKPNLVLSYSGYNDSYQHRENSSIFAFPYLCETMDVIAKNNRMKVVYGVESEQKVYEEWLQNERYMKAVAEVNEISFFAFIQPSLPSKKNLTCHDEKLLAEWLPLYTEEHIVRCRELRNVAKQLEKENGFIYDLSAIFDHDDVYMDICHVYERGNRIIADNIWNIIKDKIPQWIMGA